MFRTAEKILTKNIFGSLKLKCRILLRKKFKFCPVAIWAKYGLTRPNKGYFLYQFFTPNFKIWKNIFWKKIGVKNVCKKCV